MTIRVVIADDQAMVRRGFRLLLDDEPDLTVVDEAGDGEQALAAVRRHRPDVALIDIRMPILDGLAATRRIVADGGCTRIIILTTFNLDEYVFEALRAGASGYLLKDAPAETLIDAVRVVAAGDATLAPSVARRLIEQFSQLPQPRAALSAALAELTPRELDVLHLVARGRTNAEIAADLFVSEHTAKTHVSHLLAKLDLRDRVQAVIFAYESGLIRAGGPD